MEKILFPSGNGANIRRSFIYFIVFLLLLTSCKEKKIASNSYEKLTPLRMPETNTTIFRGTLAVPENRTTGQGRTINLNVVVIPAIAKDSLLAPIFYIEGGPGVAAANSASFYADSTNPYRQKRDIVLVDARGTGNSNPLHCSSLQYKEDLKGHLEEMYPEAAVKQCADSLSKVADLTQYTTVNIVKDLEDVRKWLGYEKISLMGVSYGTRVSLVYMKLFPNSIDQVVLWSPTYTYSKMPQNHAIFAQRSIDQLFEDCGKNEACKQAYPNLGAEFIQLKNKAPFAYEYAKPDGKKEVIKISWDAFQTKMRTLLYSPGGMRRVPFLIHQTFMGNLQPFVDLFPKEPDYDLFLADGLYLCITCTEDVPFIEDDKIDSLTRGTFMGTYRIDQQKKACRNWPRGEITREFFEPVKSTIHTLIISGSFDPVTPTSMAEEIASTLPNSKLVIIPQMAHMFDGLSNESCFDRIVVDFLHGIKNINTDCIKDMQPQPYRIN